MSKQIPSRSQSASQPRRSSSKAVPSRRSAGKRSRQSNDGTLTVATPKTSELQFLKDRGIVVPEEIPDGVEEIHLDFTTVSSQQVGAIQSRFAVRHSHAIYHAALYEMKLARLRRDLRIETAKFRFRFKDQYKTKYELDDAMVTDDLMGHRQDEIVQVEAELTVLNAIATGYEDIRNAASREVSRRTAERAQT
jgi:hypothetical protein